MPDAAVWQRASPFAVLFFFGRLIKAIARNAVQSFAPIAAFLFAYQGNLVDKLVIVGVAFFVIATTFSVLSYWFFRFQLRPNSILIRQGILRKTQLDIHFDRIQGINTEQNIVYRFFDLVTVAFDTAGSAGNEGHIPAVSRTFANSLRSKIGSLNRQSTPAAPTSKAASDRLLLLNWKDMIRIGLADRRALVALALLGPVFERLGDQSQSAIARYLQDAAGGLQQFDATAAALIVIALISGAVLLLAAMSIGAAFLRYHHYELLLDGPALRSHGGLLTRHELSMDLSKVQTLQLHQGIILRWMQRFRMHARQATSARGDSGVKSFSIPLVTADQSVTIAKRIFHNEHYVPVILPADPGFVPVSAYYLRARILLLGLLPLTVTLPILLRTVGGYGLLALFWLPIVALIFWQSWRRYGYRYDDEGLTQRSGFIGYRTVTFLFRKVQRVTITQSRFQRRKGFANLKAFLASGRVRVLYIPHDEACRLRDYMLFKVESSQRAWH